MGCRALELYKTRPDRDYFGNVSILLKRFSKQEWGFHGVGCCIKDLPLVHVVYLYIADLPIVFVSKNLNPSV